MIRAGPMLAPYLDSGQLPGAQVGNGESATAGTSTTMASRSIRKIFME